MQRFNASTLEKHFTPRKGERRLGDTIRWPGSDDWRSAIKDHPGQFVILGIPEDIGPVANLGKHGTKHAFSSFLDAFLGVQDNRFLRGEDLLLLGSVSCFDLLDRCHQIETTSPEALAEMRALVEELDQRVYTVIQAIVEADKIPVVIGGGHNNAYGMLKGTSLGLGQAVQCINFDAHADLRRQEGRHSGNGFRYALDEGYMERYFAIGLHEGYNNEDILELLESDQNLEYFSLEEYIHFNYEVNEVVNRVFQHLHEGQYTGLELDLDCLPQVPSSAHTPVGISVDDALKWIWQLTTRGNIVYFHIAEGIPTEHYQTGKLISYFVTTFIKAYKDK